MMATKAMRMFQGVSLDAELGCGRQVEGGQRLLGPAPLELPQDPVSALGLVASGMSTIKIPTPVKLLLENRLTCKCQASSVL